MKGFSLLVESAESLPFLGLYDQPQAYCVVKYGNQRKVTPIAKVGRNAYWMFETQISLVKSQQELPIQFYIYNSNSNAEDELLGWIHIQKQDLAYIVMTKTKLQLLNVQGHRIHSYINISTAILPPVITDHFTTKESIKIQMVNHVQIQEQDFSQTQIRQAMIKIIYGDKIQGLRYGEKNKVIFQYASLDQVKFQLEGINNIKSTESLIQSFNVKNLKEKQPHFLKFRFFNPIFPKINYIVSLVMTVIPNSNLQQNFSWIQLNLKSDIKQSFFVRFYSPLESVVMSSVGIPKMLKLPSTQSKITFQYFDTQKMDEKQLHKQKDEQAIIKTLSKYKPHHLISISTNQLQWTSNQHSQYSLQIKKQKITKNFTIEFQAFKQPKTIVKQIYPANFVSSSIHNRTIKLNHVKVVNCYLYQVLPQGTELHLYNVGFDRKVCYFGSFVVKPNQAEYIAESRVMLPNDGGILLAICYELKLKSLQDQQPINTKQPGNKSQNSEKANSLTYEIQSNQQFLQNHLIFKVNTQKGKDFLSGKVIYNRCFLSFAKKVTLTKICKKFQLALHNEALSIQPKSNNSVPFKNGLLQLINCQFLGLQHFHTLSFKVGQSSMILQGFGDEFLCQKSHFFYVQNENIQLRIVNGPNQLTCHYHFSDLFGCPENTQNQVKTYFRQILLKEGKLKLWYKFTPLDDSKFKKQINLDPDQTINRYSPKLPIKLCLRRLKILRMQGNDALSLKTQNQLSLKIRLSQQNTHFQSNVLRSATGSFYLDPSQNFLQTKTSQNDEGRYIFISVQLAKYKQSTQEVKSQTETEDQAEKNQIFYNAYIDISKVIGKGIYQVKLCDSKSNKVQAILQCEVISENMLQPQFFSNIISNKLTLFLKPSQIRVNNNLSFLSNYKGYEKSLLKNIYTYFAIIFLNDFYYCLVMFDSNSKYCETSSLPIKQILNNQKLYIDKKSIVTIKFASSLKKYQGKQLNEKLLQFSSKLSQLQSEAMKLELDKLQIQIMGQKSLSISQLQLCQNQKQKQKSEVKLNFLGNRQIYSKYSQEQIFIIRKSISISLLLQIIKSQQKHQNSLEIASKINNVQISVLKNCIGIVQIKKIGTSNIQDLKSLINGQVEIQVNKEILEYRSLQNIFSKSISVLIPLCELEFKFLNKNNSKITIKTITLPTYLKTNQAFSSTVQIGPFVLHFQIQCYSNTLTSFNQGVFELKDVSFVNSKIQSIKVHVPFQQSSSQQVHYLISSNDVKNCLALVNQKFRIQRKMKNILKSYLMFETINSESKKKQFSKIYLSQLSFTTKFNHQNSQSLKSIFTDQIQVPYDKGIVTLSISGQYTLQNASIEQNKIPLKYSILGQKDKEIQISQQSLNLSKKDIDSGYNQKTLPTRQNGIKLQLELPEKFMEDLFENNMYSVFDQIKVLGTKKDEQIVLLKSKERQNIFYKYLDKLMQVKQIVFKNPAEKKGNNSKLKIQMLKTTKNTQTLRPVHKFMINQNPQYIITIFQSTYMIPKCIKSTQQNKQSLILSISVHKLLSQILYEKVVKKQQIEEKKIQANQRRLLCLKTSPNDQVLTNKFCLYFKHGIQEQIIFGIDVEGNVTNDQNTIQFGYDGQDDEIDIFLCVEHFWIKSSYTQNTNSLNALFIEKYSYSQIQNEWLSIMPLSHYLLKISDIKKNDLKFVSVLKPYEFASKFRISLSRQIIQRFEKRNVTLLGHIGFKEGNWGNLTIKVNKLGPIKFMSQMVNSMYGEAKILCFLKISIQYKKSILKEINTEAKQWAADRVLEFKTYLNYLFLQCKSQSNHKYLKFQLFTLTSYSSTQRIFEKRYPLQQILSSQLKDQKIDIKISESDTKNLTEKFQMQVVFNASKDIKKRSTFSSLQSFSQQKLLQTSKQNVDQIDLVSYKGKSFVDVVKILFRTTDKTHFCGYLKQIKQSFVYQKVTFDQQDSPLAILMVMIPYLGTNARFCYYDILEMVQMCIVKNNAVIKFLDEIVISNRQPLLYALLQSIMQRDNKQQFLTKQQPLDLDKKIEELLIEFKQAKSYNQKVNLQKYFVAQNVSSLLQLTKMHSLRLNTKQFSQKFISQQIVLLMLSIIDQIIQISVNFTSLFVQNIRKWIQFASYKDEKILVKFVNVIDKLLKSKTSLDHDTVQHFLKIMVQRKINLDYVYQYWTRVNYVSKSQVFNEILQKYFSQKVPQQLNEDIQNDQLKKAKILKLIYSQLIKLMKRGGKSSQNTSRVKSETGSDKNYENILGQITLKQELIEHYKVLFEKTLVSSQNLILLNSISQLVITWKQLDLLNQQSVNFFSEVSKNFMEKDKKVISKTGTLTMIKGNKPNNAKQVTKQQTKHLALVQRNKKSIIQNFVKILSGNQKVNVKIKKEKQDQKKSQGFTKYSKYLITR